MYTAYWYLRLMCKSCVKFNDFHMDRTILQVSEVLLQCLIGDESLQRSMTISTNINSHLLSFSQLLWNNSLSSFSLTHLGVFADCSILWHTTDFAVHILFEVP